MRAGQRSWGRQMPSVFESFNAKNLSPLQVAKTFIPPRRQFLELCLRSHALVLGPRGSGKTTLLKMLQVQALSRWEYEGAAEYVDRVDFNAVFIPADTVWKAQMECLTGARLSQWSAQRIGTASFTSHIFISLLTAFEAALAPAQNDLFQRFHVQMNPATQANLVRSLATGWMLSPELPSLLGLKVALRQRLAEIASLADRLDGQPASEIDNTIRSRPELHLAFYEQTIFAIELFNALAGSPDRQWALLFDELEIAPDGIRRQLLALLRGTETRVLLKLSMSPYNQDFANLFRATGGKPGDDFLPISLWYSEKEEAVPFASELTRSILQAYSPTRHPPQGIFGTSDFDIGRQEQRELGSAYKPGSSNYRRFVDLAARDPSFASYLAKAGIDLKRMHEIADERRAASIRKLTSVVTVREAFIRDAAAEYSGPSPMKLRSRKRPQLYTGASALYAITEGNPRWIIGTLGPLLKVFASEERQVSRTLQTKAINVAVGRFRALLSTVEVQLASGPGASRSLLHLIDLIGRYFHNRVVRAAFAPEPPTTFVVDEAVPPNIVSALEVALNVGAIVLIPDTADQKIVESLVGKRFRLSYLLAPHFKLPLTSGKSRNLSSILLDADPEISTIDLFEFRS